MVEALPTHICPQCNYHQDHIIFIWLEAFGTEILVSPGREFWYLSFIQEVAPDQCRGGMSCNQNWIFRKNVLLHVLSGGLDPQPFFSMQNLIP